MAFTQDGHDCAANNRQHLNLSIQAYEVIKNDMFAFHEANKSGFINRIFHSFYPKADASISRVINCRRGEVEQLFTWLGRDEEKLVIRTLLQQEKNRLIQKARSYGKDRGVKIWLNKENLKYLSEPESECGEEKYYSSRGEYVKSVLEEYARLPYVRREQVYFSSDLQKIQNAIQAKPMHQLRVETGSGTKYSVYPYKVLCDPLSTANYLVGYSRLYNQPEDRLIPCSFRIAALKSVLEEKSKSAFLKKELFKELDHRISSQGVQFLLPEEEEIQVRLSAAGQAKYLRYIHLRPTLDGKLGAEQDIFVFHCTAMQAEFYFFKFGADAEILQPASLREHFIDLHRSALNSYLSAKEDASSGSKSE